MNNQRKFRVWDKLAQRMIYPDKGYQGHYVLDLNGRFHNLQNGSGGDDYVVMEYTGLTDSKGNDICQGDILKEYINNGSRTAIGVCKQTIGGWKIFSHPDPSICYHGWKDEIIGNIFENHELLTQHEQNK